MFDQVSYFLVFSLLCNKRINGGMSGERREKDKKRNRVCC